MMCVLVNEEIKTHSNACTINGAFIINHLNSVKKMSLGLFTPLIEPSKHLLTMVVFFILTPMNLFG